MDENRRPEGQAENAVREGIDRTKAAASQAEEEGKRRLAAEKDTAAGKAEKVSGALEDSAARLREQGEPTLAQYTERVASSVSGLAESFRGRSLDELIRDTRNVARRDPGVFFAGSVALGFALSRFFKASGTDNAVDYGGAGPAAPHPESQPSGFNPPNRHDGPSASQPRPAVSEELEKKGD